MTTTSRHWEGVYSTRGATEVSWFEAMPDRSLRWIERAGLDASSGILDAGGGASALASELLARGYHDVTVADISAAALEPARVAGIATVRADLRAHDFGRQFDLWHDRAVLHFMVEEADRDAYLAAMRRALRPGGHAVIATFGPDGPDSCSGLPVRRYGQADMAALEGFRLIEVEEAGHRTPSGATQQFLYALLERDD